MKLLSDVAEVTRAIPAFVIDALDRWLIRTHHPLFVDGKAFCSPHRRPTPWPCDIVCELLRRRDTRQSRPHP